VIDENLAQRRQAAVEAEIMVNQLATQLITHQKVQQAGSTIAAYREQGQHLTEYELRLALEHLQAGKDAAEVLQNFSHRLTQKLLHPTSILLKQAAQEEDPSYFEWLQDGLQGIFDRQRKLKK
ncbi:MAG TPA: glutamyl-tRNA reductase, partial [Acinetobacter radioresistens]|nr:glutamyl-tRNA reductase [Acinetobacter radioresistens]